MGDDKTNTGSLGGNQDLADFYERKGMDTDGNRIEYVPKPIGEHCKLIGKAIQQNYQNSTPLLEWKTDEAIANYTKETVEKIKNKRETSSVTASASASAATVVEMANELYYGFSDGSTGGSSSSSTRSATAAAASATTAVVVVDEKKKK